MTTKLDASLKGKFVNVNDEKVKIVKLDRASGSYVLEDKTHVPADELTKKGRGLFYTPPRKRKTAAAKPAAKPASNTRRSREEESDAVVIDRALKGKSITLNPGTSRESKEIITAIVKDVGYKTESGTVVPADAVFKKGRGVFATLKKAKVKEAAAPAKKTTLKPKAEIKKASGAASGGLKPKQQVKRRGDSDTRSVVKKFTQSIAQNIEDGVTEAVEEALANGTLSELDVKLAAVNVTFENRGLLLEAAFVPGDAKKSEVKEFTDTLFGDQEKGGADDELDEEELDEELDEEEEDLDEEEEDDSEEEDEELDEEEEDLDEEEEDDSEEEDDDFEDLDGEEEDEEGEEEVDFDAIAESIGADADKVAKYGQLYIDADFDAGVTIGNKVRDTRTQTVYFFVGSTTETDTDAKVVLSKKGGKLTTVSLNTFATHFEEV